MEFNFRSIQPADNFALERLIKTVMPEFGADGPGFAIVDAEVNRMYEAYNDDKSYYLVAEENGKIVGGAGIGPLTGAPAEVCELRKMYVFPEGRGRGLGNYLIRAMLTKARELGYQRCYLETLERMESANRLYQKFGFTRLPKPIGQTGHFGCDRWYAKDISEPRFDLSPVTLTGKFVRLEPLTMEHLPEACRVSLQGDLFRWYPEPIFFPSDMERFFQRAFADQRAGLALPFATIRLADNQFVGSTRFGSLSHRDRRAELGWTWLIRSAQRTAINTEAKFLMLQHAFETWSAERVELKTDFRNTKSRVAILRIGATEEGILRHHILTDYEGVRDTVFFSILRTDWPAVKENLSRKLFPK